MALAGLSIAGERAPAEPDFSPPPVPGFMLRKPEKPLTLEEMRRQADEAAARVRARREPQASAVEPTPPPAPLATEPSR